MFKFNKLNKGFTLIEILIVIGIIAVLATIVIIAINPARQFAQARNTQRTSNVNTLLNAIGQKLADKKGVMADCLANISTVNPMPSPLTSTTGKLISSIAGDADLSCLTPTYIPSGLPYDPNATGAHWTSATDYNTGYRVFQDNVGRVTVFASSTELGDTYTCGTSTGTFICVVR